MVRREELSRSREPEDIIVKEGTGNLGRQESETRGVYWNNIRNKDRNIDIYQGSKFRELKSIDLL